MISLEQFELLSSFKTSKEPEADFLAYCSRVFGSVEKYHVDFKEKRDRRTSTLASDDKKNLAKAVSGFANSGGGTLIWGIEDKTLKPKPISNIDKFLSELLSLAPQTTDPVVKGIDGECISSSDNTSGFALIHIPESLLPPHRVVLSDKDIKNHYYIRSGDSFVVAPHAQLEDMFGRRPKPNLEIFYRMKVIGGVGSNLHLYVILGIKNSGRGSAKSPFFAVQVQPPYQISDYGIDGNMGFGMKEITKSVDTNWHKYGSTTDIVIHPNVTHDVTSIMVEINRDKIKTMLNIKIDYQIAAEGIPLTENKLVISWDEISRAANPQQ